MHPNKIVVHLTHEATHKIGGIGAVLEGIFTSPAYLAGVERSLVIGPLFDFHHHLKNPLGPDGEVFYSSRHAVTDHPYKNYFADLEKKFGVFVVYGCRTFCNPQTGVHSQPEVILIDVSNADPHPVNALKAWLYEEFGIDSLRYEHEPEYEQYVRLAPAALAALRVVGAADPGHPAVLIAHEYMGLPTILAAMLDPLAPFKTLFYAHEVATIRRLVEQSPGHDTMFYNAMKWATEREYYLTDVFGSQDSFFKHALIRAARFCDNIIAVGDHVAQELHFLNPDFARTPIDLVYNGLPAEEISLTEKRRRKAKLQQYCRNLLGFKPDYIFTHVARMTISKGLWRDLRVLEHLEPQFQKEGKTAVLLLLSTDLAPRSTPQIQQMEWHWDWPVAHREIGPDLSEAEAAFYTAVQGFNARSRHIKTVLVNQFGWDRGACGNRMPADMTFADLRMGTDLEFGQSIYEPFGIAHLEPLSFGGLCVLSSVCGGVGGVKAVNHQQLPFNTIVADYTQLEPRFSYTDLESILNIDQQKRDFIEHHVSAETARTILQRLPQNDAQAENLLRQGYEIAGQMSWNHICQNLLLPALDRAYRKYRARRIA